MREQDNQKKLSSNKCIPCEGRDIVPLSIPQAKEFLSELKDWINSTDWKSLSKEYKFKNFLDGIHFINEIARIAEKEGYHPDMLVTYNKVKISLTTHAINGLSKNDFILASKIDTINIDD